MVSSDHIRPVPEPAEELAVSGTDIGKASETERIALAEAIPLIRFAAEHKKLAPELTSALTTARLAAERDTWSPEVATKFWDAFSRLCLLIQPTTMDSLAASNRTIAIRHWVGFRTTRTSLAERTSKRYLFSLGVLILIIVLLQLHVWMCTSLSKRIDEIVTSNKSRLVTLSEQFISLSADTTAPNHQWTADEGAKGNRITSESLALNADVDRIVFEAQMLDRIAIPLGANLQPVPLAVALDPLDTGLWYKSFRSTVDRFNRVMPIVTRTQERASLVIGVTNSYILPVLFGALGAVAYVVRTISDQIRSTTFSLSSPIRHFMRVALGVVVGAVIGLFNGLSSQLTLSPLALAFLAGYGVEAVFSMFDGLLAKIKDK
ncbi:hypothetical protein [Bradyrhizobium sp. LMG 9283]|uniref:hypothetical protein n=1 Tax=Bradyrhizobium sp. LMG 9283 TaxID=592064 RepID=UPI00388FD2C6